LRAGHAPVPYYCAPSDTQYLGTWARCRRRVLFFCHILYESLVFWVTLRCDPAIISCRQIRPAEAVA